MKMNFFAIAAFLMLFLAVGFAARYCTAPVVSVTANAIDSSNQIAATAIASWGSTKSYLDGNTYFRAYWILDGVQVKEVCSNSHPGCYGMGITSSYQSPVLSNGPHTVTFSVQQTVYCSYPGIDSKTIILQDATPSVPPVTDEDENVAPIAQFNSNCNGLTCNFYDMSRDTDGAITNWAWDFGNGYTSVAQNPQHSYTSAGTYLVTLQVTDNDGSASTTTGNVTATEPSTPPVETNEEPSAYFTYSNTTPSTFQFTDASTDSDGTVTSYLWNFADGTTSTSRNPTHVFAANGTYSVVLTVTDNDRATDAYSTQVVVRIPSSVNPNPSNRPPASFFNYACSGASCAFTDASYDTDGTIAAWFWTFGDGTTSSERNPTHVYTAINTYNVTLRVTDNNGAAVTSNVYYVSVTSLNRGPIANAGTTVYGNTTNPIAFIGTGSDPDGTIVLYEWDFEHNATNGFTADWSSISAGYTTYQYTRSGTYYAKLRVTDNEGSQSTSTRTVYITGENITESSTSGRMTYDFHLHGIDALRTYSYDPESDITTVKLRITNMLENDRSFLIRDIVPKTFAEDIDDFKISPKYDKLYNRDPEVGWNVTLKPYETFTITYTFDGYKSLNATKNDFDAPRVTEIYEAEQTAEDDEEQEETTDIIGGMTGYVFGAFADPQYGLIYLIVVVVLVFAFWKREYVVEKWKSFTEKTELDE